ncbi:MAG: hypothetical protein NDI90_15545 [Nitrospira sp. BO4]|jgi:hypothetical protein|nr:hypothetical protein [Nitrospira sp. BO4]
MDRIVFENFIRASLEVTDSLGRDCSLNELERIRVENYMSVLHMAYIEWKRRNRSSHPLYCPDAPEKDILSRRESV